MAVVETLKDKAGAALASAGEINKRVIDKLEGGARINLSTATYFSDVCVRQLRAASSIRNLETLQKFIADSIVVSSEVANKMLSDGKTWMSLASELGDQAVESLAEKKDESIAVPVKKRASVKTS